jgi:hypothetical protein
MIFVNKHSNIAPILLFSFMVALTACSAQRKSAKKEPEKPINYLEQGFVQAKVTFLQLDGCSYMLQLTNEEALEPSQNLPEEFKKNDLAVWLKYKLNKNGMSVCMAGKMVDVIDIKLRE